MTMDEYLSETGVNARFFAQHMEPPVTDYTFRGWRNGETPVPLDKALEIQKLTRNRVKPIDWIKPKTDGGAA